MTVVFVLWIFTSSYSADLGVYPTSQSCAVSALQLSEAFNRSPRPFLFRLACLPKFVKSSRGPST